MPHNDPRVPLARLTTPIVFVTAFFLFALLFLRMPLLNDSDSYYHLAVGRLYAQEGLLAKVPWARFSILAGGGDKELLFHLFLIPFVTLFDPAVGGRLALALLNAIVATILTRRGVLALGWSGLLIPPLLWIAAPPFLFRVVRLRPELPALILLLLAITVRVRRRDRFLGLLALLFTLAYTAFHVFLGLCAFWALMDMIRTHGSSVRLGDALRNLLARLAWPASGTALGLALHPYPLNNLVIWYVQNVEFFLHKRELNVGLEILPPPLGSVAIASAGWLLAIVVIVLFAANERASGRGDLPSNVRENAEGAGEPQGAADERDRRTKALTILPDPIFDYVAISALLFAVLFLFMTRMATYAFPFVTLLALEWARNRTYLRAHDFTRTGTFAVAILIGIPHAMELRPVQFLLEAGRATPEQAWEHFGRSIPKGAKVATEWVTGEHWAFWAPQGRYLNVLDPIFMALPYPRQYRVLRAIYSGEEPDVPHEVTTTLDSDYIALDTTAVPPLLLERLRSDPRAVLVHGGVNVLYRIVTNDRAFVVPGFVRIDSECARRTYIAPPHPDAKTIELAPYGPSWVAVDGHKVVETRQSRLALIGHGFTVTMPASGSPQRIDVTTCRAPNGMAGFYLLTNATRNVPRATAPVHVGAERPIDPTVSAALDAGQYAPRRSH
jgi:hypothetical protein